jgi:hypothetical protein
MPLDICDLLSGVGSPGKRKEEIREPIQEFDHNRVDLGLVS